MFVKRNGIPSTRNQIIQQFLWKSTGYGREFTMQHMTCPFCRKLNALPIRDSITQIMNQVGMKNPEALMWMVEQYLCQSVLLNTVLGQTTYFTDESFKRALRASILFGMIIKCKIWLKWYGRLSKLKLKWLY